MAEQPVGDIVGLVWGLKQSFRAYVEAAGGVIQAGAGAERDGDGAFVFAAASEGGLRVGVDGKPGGVGQFVGEVSCEAHGGMLKVFLADPSVEIGSASAAIFVADSRARDRRVELAQLDLSAATTADDGELIIPSKLSRDGWRVLWATTTRHRHRSIQCGSGWLEDSRAAGAGLPRFPPRNRGWSSSDRYCPWPTLAAGSRAGRPMDVSVRAGKYYAFEDFVLDPARRTLTRAGQSVALTPTQFDTLLYLVEHPGEVVTRDQLLDAVWPRKTVDAANVSQTIFTLRRALSAAGAPDRLIATAPGAGYRFACPVEVRSSKPDAGVEGSSGGERSRTPTFRGWGMWALILALLATGGAGLGVWFLRPPSGPPSRNVIVLGDFQNLAHDPQFDQTLQMAGFGSTCNSRPMCRCSPSNSSATPWP